MKNSLFTATLSIITLAVSAAATITQPSYGQNQQNNTFFCGISRDSSGRGVPATFARTSQGTSLPVIRWVDKAFPAPWTPEKRCEEISARFQQFYDNGTLNFLRAGKSGNQPVLCVASFKGGDCLPKGVLVTLKPGTNPQLTLERIMDYSGRSSGKPIELSSNQDVVSSVNDAAYLDMKKFLGEVEGSGKPQPKPCPSGRPAWEC
ncbi:MAG: COP23 domain-containing protein [Gloeotrichia echinulata GP01]